MGEVEKKTKTKKKEKETKKTRRMVVGTDVQSVSCVFAG